MPHALSIGLCVSHIRRMASASCADSFSACDALSTTKSGLPKLFESLGTDSKSQDLIALQLESYAETLLQISIDLL